MVYSSILAPPHYHTGTPIPTYLHHRIKFGQ
jgi:hypothetical protein